MLKPHVHQSNPTRTLVLLPKPFIHGNSHASFPVNKKSSFPNAQRRVRVGCKPAANTTKAALLTVLEKGVKVKAVVTLAIPVESLIEEGPVKRVLDNITDLFGKTMHLELISAELDKSGKEKPTVKAYAHWKGQDKLHFKYEADFKVPEDFGEIGAIFVENDHHREMHIRDINLEGPNGTVHFTCNSWIQSRFDTKQKKRIFFSDKSYLPSQTPDGLTRLRDEELVLLRGNGQGERKRGERIYDYDVYNDLGQPDNSAELARPVLGGTENPYPRRCRSGRPHCKKDPSSETRGIYFYVPRDEEFSEVKGATFGGRTIYSVLHSVIPTLETYFIDQNLPFPYFTHIDTLFNDGINVPYLDKKKLKNVLPNLIKTAKDTGEDVFRFETPSTLERDSHFWIRDEEFGRQAVAGLHPCHIQLITEWPLKSKLDPKTYGPPESAITTEIIERQIKGFMSVNEAIKQKKLFLLDYYDIFLPYVEAVRKLDNTTLYGSRTVFFLNPDGTLRPVAIELCRPPMDGKPQWKQAYTPSTDSTGAWLWRLAKTHVLAHDSGYHQLISHWLRTHACTEPYIIAANRQLSAMHPIYRLLHPHFRYTMEINALARDALINAGGTIETSFSPMKYSILLSSVIYGKAWRFDQQALPKDLISRGMAVPDPFSKHGIKLAIEDYPYANDGLALWEIIKEWVSDYVNHYYPESSLVASDKELQAWWTEVREKGHADKKDEPWWPVLNKPKDLIEVLTTIIWTASAHHAAVNFGQYTYAGYFPNRPTTARKNMPTEDPTEEEWKFFMEKPEVLLLSTFPSQVQATKVMAVLDVLSSHAVDEEYLGNQVQPSWLEDPCIKGAFERFSGRLKELEGIIDQKNTDRKLKNRNGAGIVPYELLKPYSGPGVTAKGVPYSISI